MRMPVDKRSQLDHAVWVWASQNVMEATVPSYWYGQGVHDKIGELWALLDAAKETLGGVSLNHRCFDDGCPQYQSCARYDSGNRSPTEVPSLFPYDVPIGTLCPHYIEREEAYP